MVAWTGGAVDTADGLGRWTSPWGAGADVDSSEAEYGAGLLAAVSSVLSLLAVPIPTPSTSAATPMTHGRR